jgi:hypothetical protein
MGLIRSVLAAVGSAVVSSAAGRRPFGGTGTGGPVTNPTIGGSTVEGSTLTGTEPLGHGSVSARKWQRTYDGTNWVDIEGATSTTYVLQYQDVGEEVRFAANTANDGWLYSSASATVTAMTLPLSTPASPVTGDVIGVTINSDAGGLAWAAVTFKGFTTGATYAFGLATNNVPGSNTPYLTVQSEGYDATGTLRTKKRTIYLTRVLRKAYPNDAQLEEAVSGSDVIVRFALSEPVYDDDKNGGAGTSGRNPILIAPAGWVTNTGGGSQPSTATNILCTNSSALDYRIPFGQWDAQTTMPAVRQTADFIVGFTPRHTHSVACCRFDVTGASSSHVQTSYGTVMSSLQRTATSLYAEYMPSGTLPIAGFTQGEAMDLRCRVYPTIGDTAFDTETYTTIGEEFRGCNKIRQYCDKTNTPNLAVVNFSTGNDGTAVTSTTLATANASPYLNIGKAIQGLGAGGGIIYVRSGTGSVIGSAAAALYSNTFWTEVKPYPGEEGTVTLTVGAFFTNLPLRLKYSGFTYKLTANNVGIYGNNTTTVLWWDNITFDANGFSTTSPLNSDMAGAYLTNCTGIDVTKWDDFTAGGTRCAASLDGCVITGSNSNIQSVFRLVACDLTGISFRGPPTANPAPDLDNALVEFNRFMSGSSTNSSNIFVNGSVYSGAQTIGLSFCGNVLENTEGSSPAWELFDGGSPEIATANVIVENNTVAGQRCNMGYNDAGSTRYDRLGWSLKNNAFRDWNVKGDEFVTGNGARTGAWPIQYGQNMAGNRYETSGFPGMFVGLNTDTTSTMNYTTNASATGTDAGGGNYTPTVGSDLIGAASPGQVRHDMLGNTVPATGGEVGAIQV